MKKKFMSLFLCSYLAILIVGCGTKKEVRPNMEPVETTPANEVVEEIDTENIEENSVSEDLMEEDLQVVNEMLPLMDSMLMCMYEGNYEFDTTNSDFVWNTMLYYIGNYLMDSDEVTISDDYGSAIISKGNINKYIKGYVLDVVPKFVKTDNTPLITENKDSFTFGLGDRGLSELKLVGFSRNQDDSLDVEVQLVGMDDGSEICTGKFRIEGINDETEIFPMVIVDASVEMPQPVIQSGVITEIEEETITLRINEEERNYFLDETSAEQAKTKAVGNSVDVMIDKDVIINILN